MSETEEPHDILAAEEFSIPARENRIPSDPTGIREPHDVLAAEEFAMPCGGAPHTHQASGRDPRRLVPVLLIAAIAAFLLVRRR